MGVQLFYDFNVFLDFIVTENNLIICIANVLTDHDACKKTSIIFDFVESEYMHCK